MPIQFPDFGRISYDEANPLFHGIEQGQKLTQGFMMFPQDMQAKILANQIAQVQAKYAEPMAQGNLTKLNQENQYNPRIWESEIGLRGAQATNLGAETRKTNYMLEHPGFMGGDETKSLEALRQMGLVGANYQQQNQSQQQQQQPPMPQQQQQGQPGGFSMPNPMQPQGQGQPAGQPQMGGFTPMPGNQQAQQMAQQQQVQQQQQQAHAAQLSNAITQAVQRQQQAMSIPQSQLQGGGGTPSGQGFDVNSLVQALIQKPMTDLQYKQTLTKVLQQNLAGKAYNSMPMVEKEYSLSQARGFGYTGEEASKLLNQGYDLRSMAQAKGYNPEDPTSWPTARGAPTTAIQTRIQRANSTLAALNAVDPEISAAYAKYSPRFANVSPALIKDMLSGENPDAQADALASYALYPEISALRINAMGGNVGEGAIQHIADAAFARINTLGISPNSFVYQKVQKRVMSLISKMNHAENAAVYGQRNQSFEDDDRNAAGGGNSDLSHLSDEELQRIAGAG